MKLLGETYCLYVPDEVLPHWQESIASNGVSVIAKKYPKMYPYFYGESGVVFNEDWLYDVIADGEIIMRMRPGLHAQKTNMLVVYAEFEHRLTQEMSRSVITALIASGCRIDSAAYLSLEKMSVFRCDDNAMSDCLGVAIRHSLHKETGIPRAVPIWRTIVAYAATYLRSVSRRYRGDLRVVRCWSPSSGKLAWAICVERRSHPNVRDDAFDALRNDLEATGAQLIWTSKERPEVLVCPIESAARYTELSCADGER